MPQETSRAVDHTRPDDWHLHLRDNEEMQRSWPIPRQFGRRS
jgi:dihydroorotase